VSRIVRNPSKFCYCTLPLLLTTLCSTDENIYLQLNKVYLACTDHQHHSSPSVHSHSSHMSPKRMLSRCAIAPTSAIYFKRKYLQDANALSKSKCSHWHHAFPYAHNIATDATELSELHLLQGCRARLQRVSMVCIYLYW
jgi:hypothetical protein